MVSIITLLKVSRPGWWLVNMWLYLAPTGQRWDLLESHRFWLGLVYALFPLNLIIHGMNDYADVAIDKDNDRKGNWLYGAKCTKDELTSVMKVCAVLNALFMTGFTVTSLHPGACLVVFLLGVLINFMYNFEPLQLSRKGPFEFPLVIIGYWTVTASSCLINNVPYPPAKYWIHNALLVGRTHLWTEQFDLEVDAATGKRTTAVLLGQRLCTAMVALLLLVEAAFTFATFDDPVFRGFSVMGLILFLSMECTPKKPKKEQSAMERMMDEKNKKWVMVSQNCVGFGLICHVWLNGLFN